MNITHAFLHLSRVSRGATVAVSAAGLALAVACSNASTASGTPLAASSASAPPATSAATLAPNGATFCAKLQPLVQPLVTPTLTLFKASDRTSNDLQPSDASYVECDFRPPSAQIDISLHDDSDHRFDDANQPGYAPLPGFGDHARYLARQQEMRWVDVVRGSIACEARFTIPDSQINGDWKQAAGNACNAALSVR